ncbi:MAG: amino acid permease [Terriglobia bacterium]|jgi:APA family basic amino acid/polyamine antiporter|nr:amino acid permease [Terriglobia bacterium]
MEPNQDKSRIQETSGALLRQLGMLDSAALVMGVIIGSGIFLVPGSIAREVPPLSAVIAVWLVGGFLSVLGGLALAELGASLPNAGGLYIYIERAYGRFAGFVYGWMGLAIINSGSVATMAVGAGTYVASVAHLSLVQQKVFQVAVLLFFTTINCLGVTLGKWVQNVLTSIKFGGLLVMTVFLFLHGHWTNLTGSFWPTPGQFKFSAFGIALIAVLWAYDGWHTLSFVAGEVKNPTRNIPASLILGTLACMSIYVLANVAYYSVLNPAAIRSSDHVAAIAVSTAWGSKAAMVLTVLISLSILGAINGSTFATPRATLAMANDGLFFRVFGRVNKKYHTPVTALIAHGIWAAILTLLGTFQELFTAVIFTAWIFYGLSVLAVIVLRVREPQLPRPYRCPWYPIAPSLFVCATLWIVGNTIISDFKHALSGLILLALSIPLYWFFKLLDRNRNTRLDQRASSTS